MHTKECPSCEQTLPVSEFHRDKRHSTGYTSHCKSCKRSRYYKRDEVVERVRRQRVRLRQRLAEWKSQGCQVCGYDRCNAAIDPHHLQDKEINVGAIVAASYGLDRLERELAKCVPLCANCHRELHAGVITL